MKNILRSKNVYQDVEIQFKKFRKSRNYKNFILDFKHKKKIYQDKTYKKIKYKVQTDILKDSK